MINNKKLIECENTFSSAIADVEGKYYGKLFYNCDNPISHDSNHAVILHLDCNIHEVIEDIKKFYEGKNLIPRIFQAYKEREKEVIAPILKEHGFTFFEWNDTEFLYLREKSKIAPNAEMKVRRVKSLGKDMIELVHTDDESDRMIKVLHRHLLSDKFHLLVGYVGGKAVSMGSIELMDRFSRVDDVVTHSDFRNRGYGRSLMHHLISYHYKISTNIIYLFASNPTAIKMYKAVGFNKVDDNFVCWSAWVES